MDLEIQHKNQQIILSLKGEKEQKEVFVLSESGDLARNFLEILDKFLKKCNTSIVSIENIKLQEGKDIGLASSRIVKTIVQTLQFVKSL